MNSEQLREEVRQAQQKSRDLATWIKELKRQRQELLADVLADPVQVVKQVATIDQQLTTATEVSHMLQGLVAELQERAQARAQWEAGPIGRKRAARGQL